MEKINEFISNPASESRVCVEYSPVNELLVDSTVDVDGVTSYCVKNDVYLIFNQRRLDKLGVDTARKYLDNVSRNLSTPLKQMPKMSDEQLFSYIKSRNIQSPSELLSWSKYLDDEYQQKIAQKQKEQTFKSNVEKLKKILSKDKDHSSDKNSDSSSSE